MWKFISIGCAWMEYEESEDIESTEDFVEKEEIYRNWSLRTRNLDSYNYIIPDDIEISVKDEIIEWEAVDLSFTLMKDGKKMDNYEWYIYFTIVDEDWNYLDPNEYILLDWGLYTFYPTDSWQKEFQKWLEIKKEGTFYIQAEDLMDVNEKILWRQQIIVIKSEKI